MLLDCNKQCGVHEPISGSSAVHWTRNGSATVSSLVNSVSDESDRSIFQIAPMSPLSGSYKICYCDGESNNCTCFKKIQFLHLQLIIF